MFATRAIGGFFLSFLIVFVPLMVLWPMVRGPYGAAYRRMGNVLVGQGSRGGVWFYACDDPNPDRDTEIVFTDLRTGARQDIRIGSRLDGYMPTVFVLALTLATPIRWSRRWRAVLWGLVAVHVYVALIILSFPLAYGSESSLGSLIGDQWVRKIMNFIYWIIAGSATGWMLIPVCIWALVSLRRSDWPEILQGKDGKATTATP